MTGDLFQHDDGHCGVVNNHDLDAVVVLLLGQFVQKSLPCMPEYGQAQNFLTMTRNIVALFFKLF